MRDPRPHPAPSAERPKLPIGKGQGTHAPGDGGPGKGRRPSCDVSAGVRVSWCVPSPPAVSASQTRRHGHAPHRTTWVCDTRQADGG